MSRPFGVALLMGGVDFGKPSLWVTDPSGTCTEYKCAAIGSAQEGATAMLQEQFKGEMAFEEAEKVALGILRETMEEKMTAVNVEIAKIPTATGKYHMYS